MDVARVPSVAVDGGMVGGVITCWCVGVVVVERKKLQISKLKLTPRASILPAAHPGHPQYLATPDIQLRLLDDDIVYTRHVHNSIAAAFLCPLFPPRLRFDRQHGPFWHRKIHQFVRSRSSHITSQPRRTTRLLQPPSSDNRQLA